MHLYKKILAAALTPAVAAVSMFAYAAPASAQTYGYNYGNPGVANVSVANGGVVIIRGDSGAQVAAAINAPLMPADFIATAPGSNAEVQFDGISMLRLSANTQVRFINLSPGSREMQLAAGSVVLAELQGADGSPQIDTPSLTVRPNQTGDYRVSVRSNGETLVTVRSGSATVATGTGSQTLTPGSTLVAYGPYSNTSLSLQGPIAFDSFDQFNISRDQATVSAINSNPYLSPQLAGYSNFANYGQWQNVPGYGYAWAPNNQSQTNFAPYQSGQWVSEPGYGYTWVDNAPYGYATSHYGTWFNNPNYGGWLWQPPGSQYQNTPNALAAAWLPAVVSFFLTGSNGGGFGGGMGSLFGGLFAFLGSSSNNANIGWIPLAPGEQYQPWYGQNSSYPSTRLTNVTNVTNIYNYYSNARYFRGVTMVPVSAWRNGSFKRLIVVRPQQIKQIVLIRGAVPIVPTTANLHYTSTVAHPVVLSRTFAAPRFAAKARVLTGSSFRTQQAQIKAITILKPKVVPLQAQPPAIVRPVYHPVIHPPIHLMVIKPVARPTTSVPKPIAHPATTVKPSHSGTPVLKPGSHPVTPMATPHSVVPPVRPVIYPAAPVNKPTILRSATPLARRTSHPVAPVVRPVMAPAPVVKQTPRFVTPARPIMPPPAPVIKQTPHPVTPTRPIVPPPAPVVKQTPRPVMPARAIMQPPAPVVKQTPRPEAPVFRPAIPPATPVARPITHPQPVAKPAAHPTPRGSAKPAATPRPGTRRM